MSATQERPRFATVHRLIEDAHVGSQIRLTFDGKEWKYYGVPVTVVAHVYNECCGEVTDPTTGHGCRCCYE